MPLTNADDYLRKISELEIEVGRLWELLERQDLPPHIEHVLFGLEPQPDRPMVPGHMQDILINLQGLSAYVRKSQDALLLLSGHMQAKQPTATLEKTRLAAEGLVKEWRSLYRHMNAVNEQIATCVFDQKLQQQQFAVSSLMTDLRPPEQYQGITR